MPSHRLAGVVAVSLTTVLAGCGGSSHKSSSSSSPSSSSAASSSSSAGTTPLAATNTVTIKNFDFSPKPVNVSPGATVTVVNADTTAHTVTSDDKKSFDTKHVNPGKTATFVAPATPGTYAYHCSIHSGMKATVVVQ